MRIAMQMTGHNTWSIFERYDIVSEGDLYAAAGMLGEAAVKVTPSRPSAKTRYCTNTLESATYHMCACSSGG